MPNNELKFSIEIHFCSFLAVFALPISMLHYQEHRGA